MTRPRTIGRLVALAAASSLFSSGLAAAAADPPSGVTELASGSDDGQAWSGRHALSDDGRYLVFRSVDPTLVPGDTNDETDVFVRDRQTGALERVSVASDGTEADRFSWGEASISADGRFVAFGSYATNLVPGDTNNRFDVFVHDRQEGTTELVSAGPDGAVGDGDSEDPTISADGRFVAFRSEVTNLVPGDTNEATDVFVRDRQAGTTERVSMGSDGAQADGDSGPPSLSADGRFVVFRSSASNLDPRFTTSGPQPFRHDRETGETKLVAIDSLGQPAAGSANSSPDISNDGRFVSFETNARDLVPASSGSTRRVYVRDMVDGTIRQASVSSDGEQADGTSFVSVISGDGRFVAFRSYAGNLTEQDSGQLDIFIHDTISGTTERVSAATDGTLSDGMSMFPSIDGDGRHVAFGAQATTLVPGLEGKPSRVFVRDRGPALGAFDLGAERDGEAVRLLGITAFAGVHLSSAEADASDPMAPWGVSEARISYRPASGDLLVRVGWSPSLERTARDAAEALVTVPAETYGLSFEHRGVRWEVRAQSRASASSVTALPPTFQLFRCEGPCALASSLDGGWGTTGVEVVAALPLGSIGAQPGDLLTRVRAFAGPVPPEAPDGRTWLEVPDVDLPGSSISIGLAPEGIPESEVVFDATIEPASGRFEAFADGSGLPAGSARAWIRTCLGEGCRTASTPIVG